MPEDRTRITCHLPVRDAAQEKAFKKVIAFLRSKETEGIGVSGYTHSTTDAFYGYWYESDAKPAPAWVEDKIVLLLIDYKIPLSDPKSLSEEILQLKETIVEAYRYYGSVQQEVWVVAQPVRRY